MQYAKVDTIIEIVQKVYIMKIVIDQFQPVFNDISPNITRVLNTIKNYESDIFVFPELALSGYFFTDKTQLKNIALSKDHRIFDFLQLLATRENKIICLGFAELDGTDIYNTAITIFPHKKQTFFYRKTHLFYKENLVFKPGSSGYKVVECENHGIKIGTMICYDWRFPEAARKLALEGADLILCPSNLVTEKWQSALSTRALENKVYIAVANRIGSESNGEEELEFNGSSSFYNPDGDILAEASKNRKAIIMAEFMHQDSRNKSVNRFNDIITDRRPEMYSNATA